MSFFSRCANCLPCPVPSGVLHRQNHPVVERPSSAGPDNDGDVQQHGQQGNDGEYLAVRRLQFQVSFSRPHLLAWCSTAGTTSLPLSSCGCRERRCTLI